MSIETAGKSGSPTKFGNRRKKKQSILQSMSSGQRGIVQIKKDQPLAKHCFDKFNANFGQIHKMKKIKVLQNTDFTYLENPVPHQIRVSKHRKMRNSLNDSLGELKQYQEDQRGWKDINQKNVKALRDVLAKKDAFKVKYDDDLSSDTGLIGETDYLDSTDFKNLKKIDKYTVVERPDPNDPENQIEEKIDNPVKIIQDKIAQGGNVTNIQLAQERQLAKTSSIYLESFNCICATLEGNNDLE